ncbi:ABC transporter permease [Paenibacillus sp. SC116]|uniref:ABC transporter permease n=1 Tax=Paenibacillus sp. SC116 TaxID=2968986 RepID=UPI00215A6C60|nr:ABC transporter permease [Paenibacillus sp. SC116]MCR8843962.1 ABC transporter permease [Paenibacillus sp. SC116]
MTPQHQNASAADLTLTSDHFQKAVVDHQEAEAIDRVSVSAWKDVWYRLSRNWTAMTGLCILTILIVLAIIGPWLTPYDFSKNDLMSTSLAPSEKHWFGTDDLGRDMFARTWMGARISLIVGFVAAFINLIIGVIYGGIMGYVGGRIGDIMNKISEIIYSIPDLLVAILLVVVFEPSLFTIILAFCLTGWINMSWIVRGQIIQLKNQEYVLASRSLGASGIRILFRHLLPNALGPIIVMLTMAVPAAIFGEAVLSFLGLGVQLPAASWGTMINDGTKVMLLYPWRMLFPAIMISLTMLAFNMFGDGLRDALDPKLKK